MQSILKEEDGMLPKWENLNTQDIAQEEPDFDPNLDVSKYNFNFHRSKWG